jgi:uncharacterized paraquat-inducible protein A
MDRSLKVAVGVMLILFFSPLVIGAIIVIGMLFPVYGMDPQWGGYILGCCALAGLPSLLACTVGVELVRKNIREPRDDKTKRPPEQEFCPKCGCHLSPDAKTCMVCGKDVK